MLRHALITNQATRMRRVITFIVLTWSCALASPSYGVDGFEKVRCDRPIVPALIGARSDPFTSVGRLESRRKAIGLEDFGAEELDKGVGTINWRICDRNFAVLDVHDVWKDAIEFPAESPDQPAFSTQSCETNGQTIAGDFLGVFAKAPSDNAQMVPVKAAWRIDLKTSKFVPLPANATCLSNGIYTRDQPGFGGSSDGR